MMEHVTRKGDPKLLNQCNLPLTGVACVHRIISDMAVIDLGPSGPTLIELAPGITAEEVQEATEPALTVAPDVREMSL
jgi:3-oxoacid CoA-transferase subunit B